MEPEDFEKLSPEQKESYFKVYWDLFKSVVFTRMQILPIVSALAAALLVVATFNKELLPLNWLVKILISILLLIIPLSLLSHNRDLKKTEKKVYFYINKFLRVEDNEKRTFFDSLASWFLDFALYLILAVILIILGIIWKLL